MKIAATDLAMQADHTLFSRRESSETLRAWRGERPDFEAMQSAITRISDAARQLLAASRAVPPTPTSGQFGEAQATGAIEAAQDAVDNDPFLGMIRQMIEFLTGEKVEVFDMQAFSAEMRQVEIRSSATQEGLQAARSGRAGWGMEYDYHAVSEEFEQTSFSASGKIRTADGQEFSFRLDLEMTRRYREETHVSVRAGDAVRKDPLVVNFGGTAAQLLSQAGQRFRFDIDSDGRPDWLPLLAPGSGFLVLDRNGDGRIDSARELFGPHSGNGFADLARLDGDGNGWIDEGDADFDQLAVWTPAMEGSGALRPLADFGIGALGTIPVATPFALRGEGNADLGTVHATAPYLTEDGQAGSLQEIDLTL